MLLILNSYIFFLSFIFETDVCQHFQARRELEEMSEMRRHTDQLLHNILPAHVAKYFLENERQPEVGGWVGGWRRRQSCQPTLMKAICQICQLQGKESISVLKSMVPTPVEQCEASNKR